VVDLTTVEKFAHSLEKMRSGLYIVTSAYRGTLAGCTCVWVTRSSFAPPLLSVCLAPTRHTFGVIELSKRFCINVMGEDGVELARKFGFTSGNKEQKFEGVANHLSENGTPVLDAALSYLDCKVVMITPIGDHRLVAGELVDAAVQHEGKPLVYDPESFYVDEAERALMTQAG
jgi:flavin reductase (DIM6/NTAB) family NADH-FMN oxidoreductase RutF